MKLYSTMAEYLVWAMEKRGKMSNQRIYASLKEVCAQHGRQLPDEWEAEVRQTLQAHCSTSPQYRGGPDLFVHHSRGLWSCKVTTPTLDDLV
jgi:hypothetical protein